MLTLEYFYNESIKNRIPIKEFKFKKNDLPIETKKFLRKLAYHIGDFIYNINQFQKYKKLNNEFVQYLSFIKNFYFFIKKKAKYIKNFDFDIITEGQTEPEIKAEKQIKKFRKKYDDATCESIFKNIRLIDYDETIVFDERLKDVFIYCIVILDLIIYIENNKCQKILGDLLFRINFILYEDLILCKFEDLDQEPSGIGLISQINWLQKKIKMNK